MYIAVSGNLGSGKSTVAQGLARVFNCRVYPERPYDRSYIEDLFREPKRWTGEAQISFMVHKHDAIREGLDHGRFFVVDRTFSEDVRVFAERFYQAGSIDERSMQLIRQIAVDLEARLEPPRLIVFCESPIEVCEQRLSVRHRPYQSAYPPDHLEKLDALLRAWREAQTSIPVLRIHTDEVDYRDSRHINELADKIDDLLRRRRSDQFDLFGERDLSGISTGLATDVPIGPSLRRQRQIYLAAPFTDRATKTDLATHAPSGLFAGSEYIDRIPVAYRRHLLSLVSAIESHGHGVLLPHRDINRWGSRALPPSEIARRCLDAVDACDGFIGLIAESFGSHAELGYALGKGKPALLLRVDAIPTSFFGTGLAALPSVATVQAKSVPQLAINIRRSDPWPMMTQRDDAA